MAKIMIDDDLIVETDRVDEVYLRQCTISILYRNGARHSYSFDSSKEARYVFGKISDIMNIVEEHKIGVFV